MTRVGAIDKLRHGTTRAWLMQTMSIRRPPRFAQRQEAGWHVDEEMLRDRARHDARLSCCRKLPEKSSFTELLPFSAGTFRPKIPDIAAISGIWDPISRQFGVIREREGLEAVQQARLAWRRRGTDQLADPSGRLDTVAIPASTGIRILSGNIRELHGQFSGARRTKKSSAPGMTRSSRRGMASVIVRGFVLATWGSNRLRIRMAWAASLRRSLELRSTTCSPLRAMSLIRTSKMSAGSARKSRV
jgi:hypothetical protein